MGAYHVINSTDTWDKLITDIKSVSDLNFNFYGIVFRHVRFLPLFNFLSQDSVSQQMNNVLYLVFSI